MHVDPENLMLALSTQGIMRQLQFEEKDFVPTHFKRPPGKTKFGVLFSSDEEQVKWHEMMLIKNGLTPEKKGVLGDRYEAHCAKKSLKGEPMSIRQFALARAKLVSFVHPNVLRYVDVTIEIVSEQQRLANVVLYSPFINCMSLNLWMEKFNKDNSLPPAMSSNFARMVGVQLLQGLCYLHDVRSTYHGNIKPTNVLINDQGQVLLSDYFVTQQAAGNSTDKWDHEEQENDIKNVARIMYFIATKQPWKDVQQIEKAQLNPRFVADDELFVVIEGMFTAPVALDVLLKDYFSTEVDGKRAFCRVNNVEDCLKQIQFEKPLTNDSTLAEELACWNKVETLVHWGAIINVFCSRQLLAIKAAMLFIAEILVPMAEYKTKRIAVEESEWTVEKKMSDMVSCVWFHDAIVARFKLPKTIGVVKIHTTAFDQIGGALQHSIQRAITILEKSHHPNIVRMFGAARNGQTVYSICEYVNGESLTTLLKTVPKFNVAPLLIAVSCQVVNALMYLHIKLDVAHRDISTDNIVIQRDGTVKLIGFAANGKNGPSATPDISRLKEMLIKVVSDNDCSCCLLNNNFCDLISLFGKSFSTDVITDPVFNGLYNVKGSNAAVEDTISTQLNILKKFNIEGNTPDAELNSWRAFDMNAPTSEHRHQIRNSMKTVLFARIAGAVEQTKSILFPNIEPNTQTRRIFPGQKG